MSSVIRLNPCHGGCSLGDLISGEETVAQAAEICKAFEGYRAKPYTCPAGIWTIGFGRTGPDVTANTPVTTIAKETEWLENRLEKDLIWLRNKLQPLVLNSNQEAALLSLVYNIGQGNFMKSSVFRVLKASSNDKLNKAELVAFWKQWNKAGGKVQPGLVRRRQAEIDLFLRD